MKEKTKKNKNTCVHAHTHTQRIKGSLVVRQEVLAFGLARALGMCLELH